MKLQFQFLKVLFIAIIGLFMVNRADAQYTINATGSNATGDGFATNVTTYSGNTATVSLASAVNKIGRAHV